jgi:hypothetical protein
MNRRRLWTFIVFAILLVAASTFLLASATENFWFGGYGFGTILAQTIYWASYRAAAAITSGNALTTRDGAILAIEVGLNTGLFVVSLGLVFLCLWPFSRVFVAPQATYGP